MNIDSETAKPQTKGVEAWLQVYNSYDQIPNSGISSSNLEFWSVSATVLLHSQNEQLLSHYLVCCLLGSDIFVVTMDEPQILAGLQVISLPIGSNDNVLFFFFSFCHEPIVEAGQLVLIEMHCVGVHLLACLCLTEMQKERTKM